jgi:hypothetical protein
MRVTTPHALCASPGARPQLGSTSRHRPPAGTGHSRSAPATRRCGRRSDRGLAHLAGNAARRTHGHPHARTGIARIYTRDTDFSRFAFVEVIDPFGSSLSHGTKPPRGQTRLQRRFAARPPEDHLAVFSLAAHRHCPEYLSIFPSSVRELTSALSG